jgi:urease alpha subunit
LPIAQRSRLDRIDHGKNGDSAAQTRDSLWRVGAGVGFFPPAYVGLGAAGSVVTGAAADLLGWEPAFLGLAVLLGGMLLVLLREMQRSRASDRTPASP